MIYFSEQNRAILVDSINTPIVETYMWVLDLENDDFTLVPIELLAEVTCPSIVLSIDGIDLLIPANWHIVIYDEETTMMDVAKISEVAGKPFCAFVYGFDDAYPCAKPIIARHYMHSAVNVVPSLNKKQMLCHPINSKQWICIGSSDAFCKKLKDMSVGDLT